MSTLQERREVYSTRRWQRLRDEKLDLNPLCEKCDEVGYTVEAKIVHHVVHIRDGGDPFPDIDGLESLCWSCHSSHHAGHQREKDHLKNMSDEQQKYYERIKKMD